MLDKRETTSDRRSVRWLILIALAAMMMLSPHVVRLVSLPAGRILNENRTLEPWPALPNSLVEWRALARKFEAAAQDQFALARHPYRVGERYQVRLGLCDARNCSCR